jgi:hypothetical protein
MRGHDMTNVTIVSPEDRLSIDDDDVDEYFCPVCGAELALANYLTPERDYYCPYCATRQTPAIV